MGRFQDLTGKKFGRLTVIKRGEDYIFPNGTPTATWICQCECGNIKTIFGNSLRNGLTKSCGCLQKGKGLHRRVLSKDMIGRRIGKLIVVAEVPIEKSPNNEYDYYYCDCDCGTKNCIVKGVNLRRKSRPTQSCGCYNSEVSHIKNTINIAGEKYGHLTAIKEHNGDTSPSGSVLWDCICDCGNHCIVSSNALRSGDTVSCGCVASKNEERIQKVLEKYGIDFKSQYYFDDLRSPITNWILKFDFGVMDKSGQLDCLIEYDGEQHFYETRFSSDPEKNKEKFKRIIKYDEMKNYYCITHRIPLFRIDYLHKDDIEDRVKHILELRRLI